MLKRLNLNLDAELIDQLDEYSKNIHVSRSAALAFILSNFFMGQKNMDTMSGIVKAYNDMKTQPVSSADLQALAMVLQQQKSNT